MIFLPKTVSQPNDLYQKLVPYVLLGPRARVLRKPNLNRRKAKRGSRCREIIDVETYDFGSSKIQLAIS